MKTRKHFQRWIVLVVLATLTAVTAGCASHPVLQFPHAHVPADMTW